MAPLKILKNLYAWILFLYTFIATRTKKPPKTKQKKERGREGNDGSNRGVMAVLCGLRKD